MPDANQQGLVWLYKTGLDAAYDAGDWPGVVKYARRIVDCLTPAGAPVPAGEPTIAREVDLVPPLPMPRSRQTSQRTIDLD